MGAEIALISAMIGLFMLSKEKIMLYVPNHLTCVEREFDGWPKGVSTEHKDWLVTFCKETLQICPMKLSLIYAIFKYREDRPRFGALLDYTYACLDRACREVAVQKWVLK